MEIIACLENSNVVKDFKVLVLEFFKGGFYTKIKATLSNNTALFIREYSDVNERNYSYHWHDPNKKILIRWDNSPHHKHIETHPHHLHSSGNVLPSYQISCEDILKVIEEKIASSQ
ncbi:MAG: toxin-antitoxin system TumE family protein [Candidatus Anammoxibacter sp.]